MGKVLVFRLEDRLENLFLTYLDEEDARMLLSLRPKEERAPGQARSTRLYLLDYTGDPHHLAQDPTPLIEAMDLEPDTRVVLAEHLERDWPPDPCRLEYLGKEDLIAIAWPQWSVSFVGAGLEGWLDWEDIEAFLEEEATLKK
jgi:hypothetical protein